ncbi:uncharacterized protein F5147DRAFT_780286 [Suillus discolor]|uniref:Uncharacterized protein n=1 Tax=Suillus discolor TaxID=1912936 RepID=A0A9P7ETN2_9AGAM|nr:uncharacterized protein F5147DRAFT_780286 [Suillus discolor]KAG2090478.1 hypothetical protein F5147DRAFT_780286 [Suillus discolor]
MLPDPQMHCIVTSGLQYLTITYGWITQLMAFMLGAVELWKKPMTGGGGGGEDVQHLLKVVDASLDPPHPKVDPEQAIEPINPIGMDDSNTPIATESNNADVPSNPFPPFSLPFDQNCTRIALQTLSGRAREVLVGGFGKWLPSHIAMQLREIQGLNHTESWENLMENGLLIMARSYDESLEIFGMVEMMIKCQDLWVDRGGMAWFFTTAGQALYTSRHGAECTVEYGQEFPFSIATQEQFETLTSVKSGLYVYCGVARHNKGVHHNSVDAQSQNNPELEQDTHTHNGPKLHEPW